MATFEDLDDDVLYLILDYLNLGRFTVLQNLRLTSSRLKDFSDAVANRTLSLVDDEVHEQITYRLAERLVDDSDTIRCHVRDLCVVNFKGDDRSHCLNTAMIQDCLHQIQKLDSFSWNCETPMSVKILHVLQQRFPNSYLCAKVKSIDQVLLSAEQLHRLNISIPCADLSGPESISMFRCFKQALLQLSRLRHLLLDTHWDVNVDQIEGAVRGSLLLPLEPDDPLPPLESLDLASTSYVFTEQHCVLFLANLNCNRLQHLALGSPNPIDFFKVFRGKLPCLTHLDIAHAWVKDDPRYLRLEACSSFIAAFGSLKNVVLRCDDLDPRQDFYKTLANVHGPTLCHLSIRPRQETIEGPIYQGNLRKYLRRFTNLRSLYIAFSDTRSYHRCPECEGYPWNEQSHFSFIPPLPSLCNAHLSVRAPYSESSLFACINKHAHCAISHLWTTFINLPESQLETLSIRFWRWETGRQTRLKELIYDTVRLYGRLTVKVRHHRDVPVVVYKEVWDEKTKSMALVALVT